ncbi:polysaccharide lyase 6 family protein [Puniceicoccaceae bacterium K14]|nr:polysaccharide lyase 6 family protein [Puniceicoccaceae bacterium K14]
MKLRHSILALLTIALSVFSVAQAREILIKEISVLQEVANKLEAGDTLILADGEWKDVHIVLNNQGTADAPITLRAQTPGKAIITGGSRIGIGGSHIIIDGLHFLNAETPRPKDLESHIGKQPKADEEVVAIIDFIGGPKKYATHSRVTNCYFDKCNPSETRRYHWVRMWGRHNRVDHCRFEGQDHRGVTVQIRLAQPDAEHSIDHNYFFDRKSAEENGYEGIQIGQSWASLERGGCIVEKNIFEEYNGETEIISNKTCDNIIRNNLFLRSRGTLTLRHGNRTLADSNVFISDGEPRSGGIRIIGEDHVVTNNYFFETNGFDGGVISFYCGIPDGPINGYAAAHRARVANNTIINPKGNVFYLNAGFGSRNRTILAEGTAIEDNVIVHTLNYGGVTLAGDLPSQKLNGNLYNGKAFGRPSTDGFESRKLSIKEDKDGLYSVIDDETGESLGLTLPQVTSHEEVGPDWL